MSTLATAPEGAGRSPAASNLTPDHSARPVLDLVLVVGVAALVLAVAFLTGGGADPRVPVNGSYTWSLVGLELLGAVAVGTALLVGGRGRAWGTATTALFAAFTAFAGLSILWSVQPDWSWYGANQLACYLMVFAGAGAVARVFPERWPALVAGLAVAMTVLSAYALLAKVFPVTLAPDNHYARLQAPFGYWNAVGGCAAIALPPALWLGARRDRGASARLWAVPALGLLLAVVVLSYSRTAVLAAVVGVGIWLGFVPLRLRSVVVLAAGAVAAAPIAAWALTHPLLSTDGVLPGAQDPAGHTFGVVILVVLIAAASGGAAVMWAMDHVLVSDAIRRRAGTVLVALLALVPVAAVAALAASSRGLDGEISHLWSTLTSSQGGAADTSARLSQLGSSRPLYWHQGLQVGSHALLKGVGELGYGIARLRYSTQAPKSDHAHSYLIQTFADLGLLGLALTLALLVAWMAAAARALGGRQRWQGPPAAVAGERAGLVALAALVVAFGVQSALDWTWCFPGVAVPALVAAGWLAGRGPLSAPVGRSTERRPLTARPGTGALVTGLAAVALGIGWMVWQPLRSVQAVAASQEAVTNTAAFADARAAAAEDPLALGPRLQLSALYQAIGARRTARDELVRGVDRTPQDPASWLALGGFDLQTGHVQAAAGDMTHVLALDRTPDPDTVEAQAVISRAQALVAQAHARAVARRRAAHGRTTR